MSMISYDLKIIEVPFLDLVHKYQKSTAKEEEKGDPVHFVRSTMHNSIGLFAAVIDSKNFTLKNENVVRYIFIYFYIG